MLFCIKLFFLINYTFCRNEIFWIKKYHSVNHAFITFFRSDVKRRHKCLKSRQDAISICWRIYWTEVKNKPNFCSKFEACIMISNFLDLVRFIHIRSFNSVSGILYIIFLLPKKIRAFSFFSYLMPLAKVCSNSQDALTITNIFNTQI